MLFKRSDPPGGDIPPEAYQLADHLDAALAAAEDLVSAGQAWQPAQAKAGYERAAEIAAQRQVIEQVRSFEAVLIGRVLKARKRATTLAQSAGDFAGMTRLFVGGTAILVDAIEELGDSTRVDFDTADSMLAYLRQRSVISSDAPGLPEDRAIEIGNDTFLIAARLPLGPLREMIIAFLDALDAHYDLYPGEGGSNREPLAWAEVVQSARSETSDAAEQPRH